MNGVLALWAAVMSITPQSSTEGTPAVLSDVVVVASPMETQAKTFIEAVAAPFSQATLARWNGAVCPLVANLDPGIAAQITSRIRAEATSLGVGVAAEGCRGNIIVVATDSADLTARGLVKDAERTFRPGDSRTDLGRSALRRFEESDAAVRWWHVAMPVSDDTGRLAIALNGEAPPAIADRVVSRLRANIRYDMAWVIIVVDVTKTESVSISDLADYLAMVSLAQVDAEADFTQYDTVLNLFHAELSAHGMTDWDRAYLQALYRAEANAANIAWQRQNMTRLLVNGLRRQQGADQE